MEKTKSDFCLIIYHSKTKLNKIWYIKLGFPYTFTKSHVKEKYIETVQSTTGASMAIIKDKQNWKSRIFFQCDS